MASGQQPVLLSPKVALIDSGGRMSQEWYAFFAAKLRLLGTGNVSLDEFALLQEMNETSAVLIAEVARRMAEDNAVLLVFAE